MHTLSMNIFSVQGDYELHKCTEVEGKETVNSLAESKAPAPTAFPSYAFLAVPY